MCREHDYVKIGEMECNHLIKFFDSTFERRLYYPDFLQIILPCDDNILRADVSQRQPYEVLHTQVLPYNLEKLIAKLLNKELRFAKH